MKKVFGIFAVIALAVVVSVNVSMNSRDEDLSDLALANIEALASGESADCSDGVPRLCCKIWDVEYNSDSSYKCKTGGKYKCTACNE